MICTLEFYSVLGYNCLYLIFEFEIMGLKLVGWFAGTVMRSLGPIGALETNTSPDGRIPKRQEHYKVKSHQYMQVREYN